MILVIFYMSDTSLEEGQMVEEINWKEEYEKEKLKNEKLVTGMKHLEKKISRLEKETARDIYDIRKLEDKLSDYRYDIQKLENRLKGSIAATKRKHELIGKNHTMLAEYGEMSRRDSQKNRILEDRLYQSQQEVSILKQALSSEYSSSSGNFHQKELTQLPPMPPGMPPMPPGMPPDMPEGMPPGMSSAGYRQEGRRYFEDSRDGASRKRGRDDEDDYHQGAKHRCWHFGKPEGCRRGESCKFLHE